MNFPARLAAIALLTATLAFGQQAQISGQVTDASGAAVPNTIITVNSETTGVRRTATTSSFGFYQFDNVAIGPGYVITVSSRRYRFTPLPLDVSGDLTNVDLVGME